MKILLLLISFFFLVDLPVVEGLGRVEDAFGQDGIPGYVQLCKLNNRRNIVPLNSLEKSPFWINTNNEDHFYFDHKEKFIVSSVDDTFGSLKISPQKLPTPPPFFA